MASARSPTHGACRPIPEKPAARDDEIPDPMGEDLEFHRECCRRLSDSTDRLARWIRRRDASIVTAWRPKAAHAQLVPPLRTALRQSR